MKIVFYRDKASGKIVNHGRLSRRYAEFEGETSLNNAINDYNKNSKDRECFVKELTETEIYLLEMFEEKEKNLAQAFEEIFDAISDVKSNVQYLQDQFAR